METIIPAAGISVRSRPRRTEQPSEMFSVGNRPVAHWAMEKRVAEGAPEPSLDPGCARQMIEVSFLPSLNWEWTLRNDHEVLANHGPKALSSNALRHATLLEAPSCPADAVIQTEKHGRNKPLLVTIGEPIKIAESPISERQKDVHEDLRHPILAMRHLLQEGSSDRGMMRPGRVTDNRAHKTPHIGEKQILRHATSCRDTIGRCVLAPNVFNAIRSTPPAMDGEPRIRRALRNISMFRPALSWGPRIPDGAGTAADTRIPPRTGETEVMR